MKNIVLSSPKVLFQQVIILNPMTLPLWLGNLIWLLFARDGRRYRVLGFAYLITPTEFIILHGIITWPLTRCSSWPGRWLSSDSLRRD